MRDAELARELRASAPHVTTAGVLERVARKRAQRRVVRRVEVGMAALLVVGLVLAGAALVHTNTGDDTVRVVASGATRASSVIALDPDQGYVRGPLVVSGTTLTLTAYDHEGDSFTFPPSRIVRVDSRTFDEEGRTDLKAEILSIADGEGARWAVTRNPEPATGLPDAFLKRISSDGSAVSKLLPPASDVVGDIAVGDGAVWVPLRDAVLRYDAATLRLSARYDLEPSPSRSIAVSRQVVVTQNGDLVALNADGSWSGISAGTTGGDRVVAITTDSSGNVIRLTVAPSGRASVGTERLPSDFRATTLRAADGRVWVEGTQAGKPAVVLLRDGRIRTTVALESGRDVSFAWASPNTVLATSNGALIRIDLKA